VCLPVQPPPDDPEVQAVKTVQRLKGQMVRDQQAPRPRDGRERPRLPPVVGVSLWRSEATDADLADLAGLPYLRSLDLSSCAGITDEGLRPLAGLQPLQVLNLSHCPGITDEALRSVCVLRSLQKLDPAFDEKVTDAGLRHLARLQKLGTLNLAGCNRITPAGIAELQKALPDCRISH
jgi:hypothetical protein